MPKADIRQEEHIFPVHLGKGQAFSPGISVPFGEGKYQGLLSAFLIKILCSVWLCMRNNQLIDIVFQIVKKPPAIIYFGLQRHMREDIRDERGEEPHWGRGADAKGDGAVPSVKISGLCREGILALQKFLCQFQDIFPVFIQFQFIFLPLKKDDAQFIFQLLHIPA